MRYRRKILRKEWTSFEEVYGLQKRLKLNDAEFIRIAGCSESSFYRWETKGLVPATTLAIIREEMAKYFKDEYDEKCKAIWG